MASRVAPPKTTAGGGFVFENDFCAWLVAAMLVGEPVFGPDYGPPVRLDFQTGPDGWLLDDVLVTTNAATTRHRFALSIKSNAQFTAKSAPTDFVEDAWAQSLHTGSSVFNSALDFMGLVTARLSGAASSTLTGLITKARANDPNLLPTRLATAKWASDAQRSLFASFACPVALGRTLTEVDTARLLQRLIFLQYDFGEIASESEARALDLCRRAVRSHSAADAQTLWSAIREVAAELRPRAGSLMLEGLIERLRARATLADYPDHAGDWATLDARSVREAALVRDSIADRIRLPRGDQLKQIIESVSGEANVVLQGPSGVGKSALARATLEHRHSHDQRTFWLDAPSLEQTADYGAFEASLQLQNPLDELLAHETSSEPLIVIDGLDRLYSSHAFRNVATILLLASGANGGTRWRVLITCQSQEWPRVVEALQRAGSPTSRWHTNEVAELQRSDLRPVHASISALKRLLLVPRVGALLTNLKLLDVVVRRLGSGADIDPAKWVGESSIADWFWTAEIDRGTDSLGRGRFARDLAQAQADQLTTSIAIDVLDPALLAFADSLTRDRLLVHVAGDRLAFAHDLYGDWARLRVLLNHRTDLTAFLKERYESPLWHRAIRLLGIHILEREKGLSEWKALMATFGTGDMTLVRDLLLEAPAFAMNAGPLLASIFPDLVAGDGALLRRLLTRFLAFATVPNESTVEFARSIGMDPNAARATYRRPHWPYWVDVLAVLHTHRDEALRVAPDEVAKIVEMWLEFAPPQSTRRTEAADIAVQLGQRAVASRNEYGSKRSRGRFYRCALLAAPERPDDVADIAKTAAERVTRPAPATVDTAPQALPPRGMLSTGVVKGPWPDGPLARVDDEFKKVVLQGASIRPLFQERPAVAREVILATLISAPHEEHWGDRGPLSRDLDLEDPRGWHPALYTHGPFLACLRENFAEGLEIVLQLVDFATARAKSAFAARVSEWRVQAIADGRSETEVERVLTSAPGFSLQLHGGDSGVRTFEGSATVYGWSSGLGNPPTAIEVALMALEQYFYDKLDAEEDVSVDLATALARARSAAVLGVLCDVGKRRKPLFDGPLRPLLSAPELYSWDIDKTVQGRSHLMIGDFLHGETYAKLAYDFNSLEHRKVDLRYAAADRLLHSAEMQPYFSFVRDWWKERRSDGETLIEMADQMDLWLDIANYLTRDDPVHGLTIVNVALEKRKESKADELQALNDSMLATTFPMRCRTILDARQAQSDGELDELWQTWRRVLNLSGERPVSDSEKLSGESFMNAVAGGIAVFLRHNEWLSRDASRRLAVEATLEALMVHLPGWDGLSSDRDVSTWTWDYFLAEAAAMLFTANPDDNRWRRLTAEIVFAEKYATVQILFSRCAEHRIALGDDFARLRRLALSWAHVRYRASFLRHWQFATTSERVQVTERLGAEIAAWCSESIDSFIDRTLEKGTENWSQFNDAKRFAEADELMRAWPSKPPLDFHLVRCSHEWLPEPDEALSQEERAGAIRFWQVALEVITTRPRAAAKRHDHLYPSEDETWVLQNLAAVVLKLRSEENAEVFWGAILDLRSEAHDWTETFLTSLHNRALSAEQMPASYGSVVRQIVKRGLSRVDDSLRWGSDDDVWDALIGIDWIIIDRWADHHKDHVDELWDVIAMWMEGAPQTGRRLGRFARWLARPAAAGIRLRTLTWFARIIDSTEERSLHRAEELEDDVANLLNVLWSEGQSQLRSESEAFGGFRRLLVWLIRRQNALGLELQGRIGGLA